ncbi:MAG: hypothetical protein KGY61_09970 [Desulfobacterales bacterium]|nr:hypothetical protein [Desulfobacterales bacterium]
MATDSKQSIAVVGGGVDKQKSHMSFSYFDCQDGLLKIKGHPQWYTVAGERRAYVQSFRKQLPGLIRTSGPIQSIRRGMEKQIHIRSAAKRESPDFGGNRRGLQKIRDRFYT